MFPLHFSKITVALTLSLSTIAITDPLSAFAHGGYFGDVDHSHWASEFIDTLAEQEIVAGFPNGNFKPDQPLTRAEFAALLKKTFTLPNTRTAINFTDVSSNYWAHEVITQTYTMGFFSGYPGQIFKPAQNIPREQALVALANGFNYTASQPTEQVLNLYTDAASISNFAKVPIAAATTQNLVVNYPQLDNLNPTRNTTRAEAAAFIYQALVSQGKIKPINSDYIVTFPSASLSLGDEIILPVPNESNP